MWSGPSLENNTRAQQKAAAAGWAQVSKTSQRSHEGESCSVRKVFLPIISDHLHPMPSPLWKLMSKKKKKRKTWGSLPGSGYHGTLVNSMQPLHVICFSSVWVYLFIFGCLSQWTCQEEKGQMCTQSSKKNLILFVAALKTSRGGSQRVHRSPLAGTSGEKTRLESGEKTVFTAPLSTSNLRRHYRNCARRLWEEMSPSLIEMGFFFLPLYYRSADGLFPHCDKRAQSRAQGDTRAGWRRWRSNQKKTRVSGKEVVSTKKNELISSGCGRMEMSRKAEYLINKMLKYWGFGSVWPVCALCVQAIYICVCVCLRLYVCILNMLLLSPAGRTQHCTLPSLVSWFVFGFFFLLRREKKVNIIKNRCGWNRANSFSSVMNYVVHGFLPANNIKWVVNDNSA